MRTGAIFARGSCRALAWVLALGVVTVLSAGQAVAQEMKTVIVPSAFKFTPASGVTVDEGGDAKSIKLELTTKEVEVLATATDPGTSVTVTATLARGAGVDNADFLLDNVAGTGGPPATELTGLTWTFTIDVDGEAGTIEPDSNPRLTVSAEEDGDAVSGSNTVIFTPSGYTDYDPDGDGTNEASFSTAGRVTIKEVDNDEKGVIVSERELTLLEGGASKTYTVSLGSEPSDDVTVTVGLTSVVNATITRDPTSLTFTNSAGTTPWNRPQTVTVSATTDSNTINGSATITHKASSNDPDYNIAASAAPKVSIVEIDGVRTVTLTTSADMVDEGKAITITATLSSSVPDSPVVLSEDVVIGLSNKDKTPPISPPSSDYSVEGNKITIAMNSTAGSTTLMAKHDQDESDETLTLVASISSAPGIIDLATEEVTVQLIDDDTYTLEADKMEVAEGKEVMLTVKVDPAAALETKVGIDLYQASGAKVKPAKGEDADDDGNVIIDEGGSTAKFTLTAGSDADSDDETIIVRAMAGGKVVGNRVMIMVLDDEAAPEYTLSLDPDAIGEADGEASVMLKVMTNKAVSADTTLKMAVDPAGTSTAMDPDDYSIMLADVMIDEGEMMGMAMLTVTPVADAMDEANETIVLNAWLDDAQVGNNVTLTIIDGDSTTFTLSGPSDMNLVEGFEYDIEVMASTPVMADTMVMIMHSDASTASADDYMIEDIMIMAGETMGRTKLMVKSDDMPDGGTDGGMAEKLVIYGMVGNMRTNDLSFYLWDLAVPALPVIAQLLLAALMAVGGYRRYRRR